MKWVRLSLGEWPRCSGPDAPVPLRMRCLDCSLTDVLVFVNCPTDPRLPVCTLPSFLGMELPSSVCPFHRTERDARLKKAASEAEEEIAAFRAAKEAEYQAEVAKVWMSARSAVWGEGNGWRWDQQPEARQRPGAGTTLSSTSLVLTSMLSLLLMPS